MLSAAIATFVLGAPAPQGQTITLYRGATVPGQSMRYWDVSDTSLSTLEPDKIFGGLQSAPIGSGKAFLIRFGDLRRVIGPNKKITKATLRLTCWGTAAPILREAGVMLVPWGEGPLEVEAPWAQPKLKPGQKAAPVEWASNWKLRRTGENSASWQSPGAQGPRDYRQLPEVKQDTPSKDQITLNGLEQAVQAEYDRPDTNYGFVLRFDGVSEMLTSESPDYRPRLELQVADAGASAKGDLSVTQIEFSPQAAGTTESNAGVNVGEQDGKSISIRTAPAKKLPWPSNNETMTLTATVKNVGSQPVNGYSFNWATREEPGIVSESERVIKPGESVKVTTQVPYRVFHEDHRIYPVTCRVATKGDESTLANNSLTVQLNALSLTVVMDQATFDALSKLNMEGSTSPEDYLQAHVEFLNDTVFRRSVFLSAMSGVLERVRIQKIQVVAGKAEADAVNDPATDGTLHLSGFNAETSHISPDLLRQMLLALHVPDLRDVVNKGEFGPKAPDVYPGLLGGDTRNNAYLPPLVMPNNKPVYDPFLDAFLAEDTDLLSATIVNTINDDLGQRNGYPGHPMLPLPLAVQMQVLDKGGKKLANADLTIYQTAGFMLDESRVLAKMKTDEEGTVLLPKRSIGTQDTLTTATGQKMSGNVFGRLDPLGSNALIAIKVEANGQTDWAWLKAWQLSDAARRTPEAAILTLRMNFSTTAIDTSSNVARNRIVTDSSGQSPANLAALLDEDPKTSVTFSGQVLDWIEIDLGRDRVVGEIQLIGGKEPFWETFDIFTYSTGQKPEQALLWTREKAWSWSYNYLSSPVQGDARSVAYRGTAQRFRYIRIVNRSQVKSGTLNELRAYPIVREDGG